MLRLGGENFLHPDAKEQTMKSMSIACLALILVAGAAPAQAALPRLAGNGLDYVLMPLLGYLTLVIASWLLDLPARLRGGQD
jgi:hypothetical protein